MQKNRISKYRFYNLIQNDTKNNTEKYHLKYLKISKGTGSALRLREFESTSENFLIESPHNNQTSKKHTHTHTHLPEFMSNIHI